LIARRRRPDDERVDETSTTQVHEVRSTDGTTIAFTRDGDGPPVVLVGGALDDGSENAALVPALAGSFTVVNVIRRGRGRSGDTQPYAVEREIEDLAAVVEQVGGPAHAFGASSGGALVLEAAAAGVAFDRVAVWEVPYAVGEEAVRGWQQYVVALGEALGRDDRGAALELFMRLAGSTQELVAQVRRSPYWPDMLELAPTLAHDAACLGDGPPPADRLATVTQPVLVLTGPGGEAGSQELAADFMGGSADAIAAAATAAERRWLGAGGHRVDPDVLGPVLVDWL
jgi:pimeloyl-ACP methyl ester carboxylesterase